MKLATSNKEAVVWDYLKRQIVVDTISWKNKTIKGIIYEIILNDNVAEAY